MYTYPLSPPGPVTIAVSAGFKKQVVKVIAAIVIFFIVYLALLIAVFLLAFAAVFYGAVLVISFPRWITLLLGAGMIAMGISLVFFLVKFVGSVAKKQDENRWQITESDHPLLFDFLKRVAAETHTPFPKKVFISPEVNASVFYDSSFLSMFLPVKKNLLLGLGLLNAINISECKAIVAHEFGHFSQRSMKVGSYTFNVNLIIYNLLYDNTSYQNFLERWGNISGVLSIFALATAKVSLFIQWMLRGMYRLINKEYMALSREMEFHADAVAAAVAGGNNLLTGLVRVRMAEPSYQKALQDANELVADNKRIDNIFCSQSYICRLVADHFGLPPEGKMSPDILYQSSVVLNSSRLNIKDQWASHPTLTERKNNVDVLKANVAAVTDSPWLLFSDPEKIQRMVTDHLYERVQFERSPDLVGREEYEQWVNLRRQKRRLPPEYKGFYDSRFINLPKEVLERPEQVALKRFDEIFTEENGNLQQRIETHQQDLEMARAIRASLIDVESFDFDGNKFSTRDGGIVVDQLEVELEQIEEKQAQLDKEAFAFFYHHVDNPAFLTQQYLSFLDVREFVFGYSAAADEIVEIVQRISQGVTLEQAAISGQRLKEIDENVVKPTLSRIFDRGILKKETNEKLYHQASDFAKTDHCYFSEKSFFENEIDGLFTLNAAITQILEPHLFDTYKSLLEYQLRGLNPEQVAAAAPS